MVRVHPCMEKCYLYIVSYNLLYICGRLDGFAELHWVKELYQARV